MMTDVESVATEILVWKRDRARRQLLERRAEVKRLEAELGRRGYVPSEATPEVTGDVVPLDRRGGNRRRLRLERVKCGKPRCKTCGADGISAGHGPYFYLYLTNPKTGRHTSKYIGKPANLPEEMKRELVVEVEGGRSVGLFIMYRRGSCSLLYIRYSPMRRRTGDDMSSFVPSQLRYGQGQAAGGMPPLLGSRPATSPSI